MLPAVWPRLLPAPGAEGRGLGGATGGPEGATGNGFTSGTGCTGISDTIGAAGTVDTSGTAGTVCAACT